MEKKKKLRSRSDIRNKWFQQNPQGPSGRNKGKTIYLYICCLLTQHLFYVNTYPTTLAAVNAYNKTPFNEFILNPNQTTCHTYPCLPGELSSPAWQSLAETGHCCFSCCPCYPVTLVTAWGLSLHGRGHVGSGKRGLVLQSLSCWLPLLQP